MSAKIEVKNLVKVFGSQPRKALSMIEKGMSKEQILAETGQTVGVNDVSFTVETGEIFVVMGLSGCGKSTILRCLNRLIEPSSGSVLIDGQDITKLKARELRMVRQNKTAMVFQQFALLPHRTVLHNTVYGLEVQGVPKEQREKRARESLAMVGLNGWENSYPDELSGGMKQRVGLARALTNDPDILLMDEAFSALDPLIREEMQDELLKLQQAMNKTIVFITHDLSEALKIGDRIAFVRDGSLVQVSSPEDIINHPADAYVANFVRGVERSKVLLAKDVMGDTGSITLSDELGKAIQVMEEGGAAGVFVIDRDSRLQGVLTSETVFKAIKAGAVSIRELELIQVSAVSVETKIQEVINIIARSKLPLAVVDNENRLAGSIVHSAVLAALAGKGGEEDVPTTNWTTG